MWPRAGELAVVDEHSGLEVDLTGIEAGIRVSGFKGRLRLANGSPLDLRPAAERSRLERAAAAARAVAGRAPRPRMPVATVAALRRLGLSWTEAVRLGWAAWQDGTVTPVMMGGTTTTALVGGGNWNAIGTWDTNAVPLAGDDVRLAGTSGSVTINVASVCRSLDCTGYTGTLTHNAATSLTIGDGTAGAGSIALKFVVGMTYSVGNAITSTVVFGSTSATQQTVTSAGKSFGGLTFGGASGTPSYLLSDAISAPSGTLNITRGTFDSGSVAMTLGALNFSAANTRTVTLGSSAISSTNTVTANTVTGLTMTATTAIVTGFNGATLGNFNYNGLSFVIPDLASAGVSSWSMGNATFGSLTVTTNTSVSSELRISGNFTLTGSLNLTGGSSKNRVIINTGANPGTTVTISCAVAGTLQDVDFKDIAITGAAAPLTGTRVGDGLGNSGITFTTPATQTWQGTSGGNWSDVTKWTSRVPLPQDDVVIASAFTAGQSVITDLVNAGKNIDWTGATGAPTWNVSSAQCFIFGNVTLATGMHTLSGSVISMGGRSTVTFTSHGVDLGTIEMRVKCFGGTTLLGDDVTMTGGDIAHNIGTFDANGHNVTLTSFSSSSGIVRTLNMGSGTWTLLANAGSQWAVATSGLTFNAGTSTISLTYAGASSVTFAGAGLVYYGLSYLVGTGNFIITGNNTFANLDLECTTARTVTLPAGGVQVVRGSLRLAGASGQLLSVVSATPGTKTNLRLSWNAVDDTATFTSLSADITLAHFPQPVPRGPVQAVAVKTAATR